MENNGNDIESKEMIMPHFNQHCEECVKQLGKPFEEVHKWLDEFAHIMDYGMRHRQVRHHEAGIQECIILFGEEAGKAARIHIIMDLKTEGWTENDPFPKDQKHYLKMGLW